MVTSIVDITSLLLYFAIASVIIGSGATWGL
jgi:Mg/Co/Ni transporter MgtE